MIEDSVVNDILLMSCNHQTQPESTLRTSLERIATRARDALRAPAQGRMGRSRHRGARLYYLYAARIELESMAATKPWDELHQWQRGAWNHLRDQVAVGRCGYEQFEPDNTDDAITPDEALVGINAIRNSIIGAQSINWSEHMYPLVSLLNRAGYAGMDYPTARANIGTLIERANAAEELLKELNDAIMDVIVQEPEVGGKAWSNVGAVRERVQERLRKVSA